MNLQRVLERTLGRRRGRAARTTRAIGHHVFEYLAPPFSILPIVDAERAATGPAPEQ